jgi:hypothetical protein
MEHLPNEITPIAWNTPLLMIREPLIGPFISAGTLGPCVMTVMTMMSILKRASELAFASWVSISKSRDRKKRYDQPLRYLYTKRKDMRFP